VCTTSPTADNLISRILEKSRLRRSGTKVKQVAPAGKGRRACLY
jgi:hypothetical protein